ncbi:hypothetical protein CYMTET_4792 [Cymbomonas tetramitiformis]|uniref:Integrase catalytic domain-containing protein n=1 Tax=Cymbomonas tetramitiformis TaxID=36881 RepID=A0AAE0LJS5_9CHLO|nr:hypothetical protein CYMTET_4792 [Cymbomonas tetramitiformis]
MVHIIPLNFQDSSAEVIARIYFDHIWKLHGAPMKIVSDRDPRFQDAMWKELMRLMGTKVASTTPYNPRSDGQAEHTNRVVVEDMLRSFVGSNPEDWDLWCANVEFAINDTRSDVTGFTPFELVLGHSPMSQLDLFLQAAAGQHSKRKGGEGTAHEMASKFAAQLEDARTKLKLAQQRQRHQFDQRHTAKSFQLGDLVWVDAKHLTENIMNRESFRKLGPRWHGPLPISPRGSSVTSSESYQKSTEAPRWLIGSSCHLNGVSTTSLRSIVSRNTAPRMKLLRCVGKYPLPPRALTFLDTSDEGEPTSLDNCLPWEQYCRSSDAFVTHLVLLNSVVSSRELRLLVLFSGTGSVERSYLSCYPKSTVVTVDHDPRWQPTYAEKVQDWDFKRYAPGYFDVIWASPPCTEYSQAKTTGVSDYCIIVHPSGALRRWERKRGGGWFLEDATRAKEPVAPFSLLLSNAFWKQASVTDEYEYRGIPYTGRKVATPTNSDDSGAGAVTWSKEKLPDSDDDDDAGVTDSKHDMDTASPKWEYDTPGEYDDTEDDVSEFDDLVADDAEDEARMLKRLGLQLIMDDKGELIWVPKGTSPTSPVQPEDQPIPEQKSDAISDDAPASVVETVRVQPKDPSGPDTGLTSMSGNNAGLAEVTKRQPRKYPARWTAEHIAYLESLFSLLPLLRSDLDVLYCFSVDGDYELCLRPGLGEEDLLSAHRIFDEFRRASQAKSEALRKGKDDFWWEHVSQQRDEQYLLRREERRIIRREEGELFSQWAAF